MKRQILVITTFFLVILLIVLPTRTVSASSKDITVLLDGLPVHFDVSPQIVNERTLVPFRFIAEALNVGVTWDGTTRTVAAENSGTRVLLQIDNQTAWVNGSAVILDSPPLILKGRTLIPLRFFSEAFACQVDWNEETRTVRIVSPPSNMSVIGFYALGDAQTSSWTNLFGTAYPVTSAGNTDIVSELALGWYTIDEHGNLLTRSTRNAWQRPAGWQDVLTAASLYSLRTEMVVHEENRDGMLTRLLEDEQAVDNLIAAIVRESGLYHGVNLNMEGLRLNDRDSFTRFVSLLAPKLNDAGKTLTLTIHPPNSAFLGYDYEALGKLADRIIIMAHDYGQRPEPVGRILEAVEMALTVVPREKLVLAISAPSETGASILEKIGIAKRYQLQGISLWRLGLVTNDMWTTIRQTIARR